MATLMQRADLIKTENCMAGSEEKEKTVKLVNPSGTEEDVRDYPVGHVDRLLTIGWSKPGQQKIAVNTTETKKEI